VRSSAAPGITDAEASTTVPERLVVGADCANNAVEHRRKQNES
jgi:hypothetical protein